jgi:hypothetical protein
MTNLEQRKLAMLRRVKQYMQDNILAPANPAAEAESTAVSNAITEAEAMAENQASGSGTKSGAVDQRFVLVDDLMGYMRSLSKAAKVLDKSIHPEVATKMQMSGIASYQDLITRANVFHATLEPIEAEFVALGASATVAADLQAKITAVQGLWNLKLSGLDLQIGGTAGIAVVVRAALKRVRKLDAILCQIHRTNPVALAQWKAAQRVERDPVTETEPEPVTPPTEGSGSGI